MLLLNAEMYITTATELMQAIFSTPMVMAPYSLVRPLELSLRKHLIRLGSNLNSLNVGSLQPYIHVPPSQTKEDFLYSPSSALHECMEIHQPLDKSENSQLESYNVFIIRLAMKWHVLQRPERFNGLSGLIVPICHGKPVTENSA